jgi:Spy/CpxP family protein refolding chaperone
MNEAFEGTRMKRFIVTVMMVAILGGGLMASAEGDGNPERRGDGGMITHLISNPRMAKKLDLTDEQLAALKELAEAFKTEKKSIQDQMQDAVMDQAQLLTAETVDEAAIYSAIDKSFERRRDMAKLQIKTLLAAKKILTPAQIKTLQAMKDDFKKNHSSRLDRKSERQEPPVKSKEATQDVPAVDVPVNE